MAARRIFEVNSGQPISFIAGTGTATAGGWGTVSRAARSAKNTANTTLTVDQLQEMTGLFKNPANGRPLFVDQN
jgi:hypothetical protein